MCAFSQKLDAVKNEFLAFAERTDCSENHMWGDVCLLQVHPLQAFCQPVRLVQKAPFRRGLPRALGQ